MPEVKSIELLHDNLYELSVDLQDFLKFSDSNYSVFKVLAIKNHKEFNIRLINELNKHYRGRYWCKPVSYYNPKEADFLPVSPFMKPVAYKIQNELRYLVLDDMTNAGKPLEIRIGNISDIASVFPVSLVRIQATSDE